jgi:hypothetical protein
VGWRACGLVYCYFLIPFVSFLVCAIYTLETAAVNDAVSDAEAGFSKAIEIPAFRDLSY